MVGGEEKGVREKRDGSTGEREREGERKCLRADI